MKYHELQVKANKQSRRVGRGISAGQGKTAGRGTKGQKSRTGSSLKPGFEGGQNPLLQRLPKLRGFKSKRIPSEVVFTGQLQNLSGSINNAALAEAGLITSAYTSVKLLHKGEVTKKATVKLQSASVNAIKALEKAGGSFQVTNRSGRPKSNERPEKGHKKNAK